MNHQHSSAALKISSQFHMEEKKDLSKMKPVIEVYPLKRTGTLNIKIQKKIWLKSVFLQLLKERTWSLQKWGLGYFFKNAGSHG